jgi:hypothetical protein
MRRLDAPIWYHRSICQKHNYSNSATAREKLPWRGWVTIAKMQDLSCGVDFCDGARELCIVRQRHRNVKADKLLCHSVSRQQPIRVFSGGTQIEPDKLLWDRPRPATDWAEFLIGRSEFDET